LTSQSGSYILPKLHTVAQAKAHTLELFKGSLCLIY
jgi:hypothetical protein